jgi:hypothetical protein
MKNQFTFILNFIARLLLSTTLFLSFTPSFSQTFESTNLPLIIIETNGVGIADEPKVAATMKIINNGEGQINHLTDSANDFDGYIGIEFRGASSQYFYPKKSYGIEIRDSSGADIDTSLLGMPQEKDWILYAPFGDKTFLRDVLTYRLANKMGKYASRTKFCELVVNGSYQGVYVLMEKIKRNKNRVAINKLAEDENSGQALTGGYIIKIDKVVGNGGDGWYSSYPSDFTYEGRNKVFYQYDYPKASKITTEQKQYIQDFIYDFETAVKSDDFEDPEKGFKKFIDVSSFVDYLILNEVSKNIDGYRLSSYLYKEKDTLGGKLYAGPIWDYNLAFGNANYCDAANSAGWALSFNSICPDDGFSIPFWWVKMTKDPVFNEQLVNRWLELRQTHLKTENMLDFIDSTVVVLEEPQQRNYEVWPVLGKLIWPVPYAGKRYIDDVNYLKTWITDRMNWLDANMGLLTATEDKKNDVNNLQAFPNPFESKIVFRYNKSGSGKPVLKVFDVMGKMITQLNSTVNENTLEWEWEARHVPAGLYISELEVNGKSIKRQLVYKTQ